MNEVYTRLIEDMKEDNIHLLEPKKEIYDGLETLSNKDLVKKIYANRYNSLEEIEKYFFTKLKDIISLKYLKGYADIDKGSDILAYHINNNNRILLVTDYDVDGVGSAAIGHKAFVNLFDFNNFDVIVNKREHGNGINDTLTEQIIKQVRKENIKLLITADHGSANEENFKKIREATGIDIIVTDHHLFDYSNFPITPNAFINPQRNDNLDVSKNISGATMLYFLMTYTFLKHFNNGNEEKINYLYFLITYVGLTIVSDHMRLDDFVNKKLLKKALANLNSALLKRSNIKLDTFWRKVLEILDTGYFIDEIVLGFNIIPVLNSPGRIADPRLSYELLVSEDEVLTEELLKEAMLINDERKTLKDFTIADDKNLLLTNEKLIMLFTDAKPGIQGILASELLNSDNYKVAICLTKKKDKDGNIILEGSGRLKGDGDLEKILSKIKEKYDLVYKGGGHKQAIGLSCVNEPHRLFEAFATEIDNAELVTEDKIYVDEIIFSNNKIITSIFDVEEAGPYGNGFPRPLFASDILTSHVRIYKNKGIFLVGEGRLSEKSDYRVTFKMRLNDMDLAKAIKNSKKLRIVYHLVVSTYKNNKTIYMDAVKIIVKE